MAWWEWIPVVKTVGHALADPPGRTHSDYIDCACTAAECEGSGSDAAVLRCTDCVKTKVAQFASEWTGASIGSDFFGVVLGGSVGAIGTALAKGAAGGVFLGLSATAWTGIGAAVAIDALIDTMIVLYKMMDMYTAARKAIGVYCRCGDG